MGESGGDSCSAPPNRVHVSSREGEEDQRRNEEMRREREAARTEGSGERERERGLFVGRLTTPHDLIVMLKPAGEASRRVGGQDASRRCEIRGAVQHHQHHHQYHH